MSDLFIKKIKIERNHNEALILGNGPSLKDFFKEENAFMENKTIFAVNYFARTAEYKKVKPEFYESPRRSISLMSKRKIMQMSES